MSKAIENLQAAQQRAIAIRPKVGGFPVAPTSVQFTDRGAQSDTSQNVVSGQFPCR